MKKRTRVSRSHRRPGPAGALGGYLKFENLEKHGLAWSKNRGHIDMIDCDRSQCQIKMLCYSESSD